MIFESKKMKKLVYGVLTSAILLSNANSHEIWIEKDKKNKQKQSENK